MAGRIVDLLSSPHLATEAVLPWLLNDTLTPAERHEVEAHLAACPACRAELARQREVMALYAASPAPDLATESETSWARLMARLHHETAPSPRVKRAWRWWPVAFALQMGVILALGAALWLQLLAASSTTPAYRGLAASAQRAAGDALVVFDPRASEAALRSALQRAGARLVDGPTAGGAYVVRFEQPALAALATLRADAVVVRAESLTAEHR